MAEQVKECEIVNIDTDGSSCQSVEIDRDNDKITLVKIGSPGDHEILEVEQLESGEIAFRIINNLKDEICDPDTGDLQWEFYEASRATIVVARSAADLLYRFLELLV